MITVVFLDGDAAGGPSANAFWKTYHWETKSTTYHRRREWGGDGEEGEGGEGKENKDFKWSFLIFYVGFIEKRATAN